MRVRTNKNNNVNDNDDVDFVGSAERDDGECNLVSRTKCIVAQCSSGAFGGPKFDVGQLSLSWSVAQRGSRGHV